MNGTEAGMHSPGKLIEYPEKFTGEIGRDEANLQSVVGSSPKRSR